MLEPVKLPDIIKRRSPSAIFSGPAHLFLNSIPDNSVQLIYVDPPFNTGQSQIRKTTKATIKGDGSNEKGNKGFKGKLYDRKVVSVSSYEDSFEDYSAFLRPLLEQAHSKLSDTGTLYVHLDYREVHYVKIMLDEIFGRDCFLNEIIWAYDYGAKSKSRWPTKHDTILVYVKDRSNYYFSSEDVDREPYMAPGLTTPEKVALGKLPTDVWWHTIVSPTGKEKTGYPTQKPIGILRRIVTASSKKGDTVLDFFGGSGTTAYVSSSLGRRFLTCDTNPESIKVITNRLSGTKFNFYK
jgi:site-specific DNA-methyltransferase (adenine-specific)